VDRARAPDDVYTVIRWLLAFSVGVVVAWMAYGRAGTGLNARTMLLATLRALAVVLVAALLLGAPAGRSSGTRPLVAVDASASWLRAARGDTALFGDAIRAAINEAGADSLLVTGDSLRTVTAKAANALRPTDLTTALRPAVDRALAVGRPLVLLTDGEVDDGSVQADMPPGSRIIVPPRTAKPDAAVALLESPFSATAGDTVTMTIVVAAGGAGAAKGVVKIALDGKMLASTMLAPLTPYTSRRVALSAPLPHGVKHAIVQAIVVADSDAESRNDTLATAIEISDKPAAVFISTAPDLDVREALSVLRGALDVPARAYLRIATNVWREEGSLKPISEADVRARALEAGMVILHGDTTWGGVAARTRGAHALWVPAPPSALPKPGESAKAAEWYVNAAPPSPIAGALAGLPWDTLPPISLASPARGTFTVLEAKLGKTGSPVAVIAGRETAGFRTLVITGSGFAGWSLRGGRSAAAFVALWGGIFDWLSAARGDLRAARPSTGIERAGEPVHWRRGGTDSLVVLAVTRRADAERAAAKSADSVRLHFVNGSAETTTPALPVGVYDVQAVGGASVLVVNQSRELVPRAPTLSTGAAARGTAVADGRNVADMGWAFGLALVLLCGEWLLRRYAGLR
jgi:hypothetical protein